MKKNKQKNYLYYLLFIGFFILVLAFNSLINLRVYDDGEFAAFWSQDNFNLFTFILYRYNTWSSRVIVEFFMFLFLKLPGICYRIANSIIMTCFVYFLSALVEKERHSFVAALITIALCLCYYPIIYIGETGWIATTLNYLWPATFLIITLYGVKRYERGQWFSPWEGILYFFTAIFACNTEQAAVIVFLISLFLLIRSRITHQKNIMAVGLLFISICSLIFILTCPGNAVRVSQETAKWYPAYASYGLFQKIDLGITVALKALFIKDSILTIIFFSVLILVVFVKSKNWLIRIMSMVPLFSTLYIKLQFNSSVENGIQKIFNVEEGMIYSGLLTNWKYLLFYLGLLLIVLIVLSSVFIANEDRKQGIYLDLILLLGLAIRASLGFSPTVFASGYRPELYLAISIVYITASLILILSEKKKLFTTVLILLIFCSVTTAIVNFPLGVNYIGFVNGYEQFLSIHMMIK